MFVLMWQTYCNNKVIWWVIFWIRTIKTYSWSSFLPRKLWGENFLVVDWPFSGPFWWVVWHCDCVWGVKQSFTQHCIAWCPRSGMTICRFKAFANGKEALGLELSQQDLHCLNPGIINTVINKRTLTWTNVIYSPGRIKIENVWVVFQIFDMCKIHKYYQLFSCLAECLYKIKADAQLGNHDNSARDADVVIIWTCPFPFSLQVFLGFWLKRLNEIVADCYIFSVKMDDGYDNQEWGESSGMRGSSEMGDVSFAYSHVKSLENRWQWIPQSFLNCIAI